MRPASILWFERLYWAGLAAEAAILAYNWLVWNPSAGDPTWVFVWHSALIAISGLLATLAARRGSVIAAALLVFEYLFYLYGLVQTIPKQTIWDPLGIWSTLVIFSTTSAAIVHLVSAPSRAWFRSKRQGVEPFRRTFE